ncbi:Eukaryotic protein of unknown function (DUF846) [Paramecium bursaria]
MQIQSSVIPQCFEEELFKYLLQLYQIYYILMIDDELRVNIKLTDNPSVPPPQTPPPAMSQFNQNNDSIPLESSNYDLSRAGHPKACVFTFLFKLIALVIYLLLSSSQILCYILVIVFSSLDFWTVKNITGRLLVGLKWETVDLDNGKSDLKFFSRDNFSINQVDAAFFWSSQVGFTIAWTVFGIKNLFGFSIFWLSLIAIVFSLLFTNLWGFYKCRGQHKAKMDKLQKDLKTKGVNLFTKYML